MKVRGAYLAGFALWCITSPVLAEQVLYCVDTAVTGFKWSERGKASVSKFSAERFTVKVVSDTARIITLAILRDRPGSTPASGP